MIDANLFQKVMAARGAENTQDSMPFPNKILWLGSCYMSPVCTSTVYRTTTTIISPILSDPYVVVVTVYSTPVLECSSSCTNNASFSISSISLERRATASKQRRVPDRDTGHYAPPTRRPAGRRASASVYVVSAFSLRGAGAAGATRGDRNHHVPRRSHMHAAMM
jgi:hypothetical protein